MKREKRVDRRNNTLVAITSVVGIVIVSLAIMSYINSPEFSPSVQRDGAGNLGGIGSGGNVGGDLGPTNPNEWRVFLTNDTFSPNLGGIVGANGVCNLAAGRAGLDGRYVAWLSSSSKDAKGKINDGKYVRIDGVKIADSKSDLLDGTLDAAIEITEYGTGLEGDAQVPNVYTGTASDGSVIVGSNGYSTCGDWNSESSEDYAGVGILSETSGDWTNSFEGDCDYFSNVENAHLYCFEVSDIFKINSSNFIEPDFGGCKKYKVWTVQDLDNVRDDLKGCYTQMADINLDGIAFDPIGGLENPFTGVYDGNGFDIKNVNNLQIKEEFWSGETIQYVSLFAVSSGEIKNINLDVNIFNELSSQANQIFLESGLVLLNNGIIKNTKISGKVHGKISIDIDSVLGVAGFSIWNNGEISNSVYQGSVSANMNNSDWDEAVVGGIAVISEGIIRNSAFIGSVTCEIVEECGGLVGDNEGEISDSYFHGVLNGTNSLWLGGLAGTSSTGGNIQDSYSSGKIYGFNSAGGIVGNALGGYVGEVFSLAKVSNSLVDGRDTGGLVGDLEFEAVLDKSYSAGAVFGREDGTGGYIGRVDRLTSGYIDDDHYFDMQASGQTEACGYDPDGKCQGVYGKTTVQMKQQSTYQYWDFANTWIIVNSKTYPMLRSGFGIAQWARWPFDSVYNKSGKQYTSEVTDVQINDALVNGASIANGKVGNSLFFKRSEKDYVDTQSDFDLYNAFSISTWMRLQQTPAQGEYYVVMSKNNMPDEKSYAMFLDSAGKLYFVFYPNADGSGEVLVSSVLANPTTWNHVAVIYDGNELKLYINGERKSVKNAVNVKPGDIQSNLIIGAQTNVNSESGYSDYYWGNIDDVRMYHRPLLEDEVIVLANGFD